MSHMDYEPRHRITANMMGSYVGKQVLMIGSLMSMNADQTILKIECTDKSEYQAQLQTPLQNYWPPNSLIELEGIPHTRNLLKVSNYNQVPAQMSDNFDAELYNETIKLLISSGAGVITDVQEHFGGPNENEINLISKPTQGGMNEGGRQDQSFHH